MVKISKLIKMNIADIEKVANRKRINAEAEKLREKVNRETANIIKLKVAQDTAYWDVKEKLHQLENNHERLQQNMVEVQMQHEAISGQYQDELRLRPETLNKLSSTREICDVLEEYSSRLKASVGRCQADQATLAEAYNKSGHLVRDIKDQQLQAEEKSRQIIDNLQEKVKLVIDHKDQVTQMFASSKQHLESELNDCHVKLAAALGQKDELFVALNDFSRKLDHCKRELERKDETISNLQMDIKKLIHELNNQGTEMAKLVAKQEKDLKEYSESNETLKKALTNQEQFTKSVCDQNNQLQEKISALEDEQIIISDKIKDLENKIMEANYQCDLLIKERSALNDEKEELELVINDKIKLLEETEVKNEALRTQITTLEVRYSEKVLELETALQESNLKSNKNEELNLMNQELDTKITELQKVMENLKLENMNEVNELNAALNSKDKIIENNDKELECKASTINQLMSDLKNVTDAKTKLENYLEKAKKDFEVERNDAKEKEQSLGKKIEHLEMVTRDKENELSKQMTIILDMRNEKERLQERLKSVQSTINNIEKEVTGRTASARALLPREAAELDDNAVMLTPAVMQKKVGIHAPKAPKPGMTQKNAPKQDNLLYNLFSDSSIDNELTIDSEEVNRRFEALSRGERISSPLPFKRGKGPTVILGGLKPANNANQPAKTKRTFFKSKEADGKVKKFKSVD